MKTIAIILARGGSKRLPEKKHKTFRRHTFVGTFYRQTGYTNLVYGER